MSQPVVYLIPCMIDEDGMDVLPAYLRTAAEDCTVFFVENERSARRFLKKIWQEMVIDDYRWYTIHKAEAAVMKSFVDELAKGNNVGIISEAGCPGIADPGQLLVGRAQQLHYTVKPLVGPSSILLALMASGMNGQEFRFCGYLPIDNTERIKAIKDLEAESAKRNSTQLFIETPYRNNQLFETMLKHLNPATKVCLAVDLTGRNESVITRSVKDWESAVPQLHKRPAIFLLQA